MTRPPSQQIDFELEVSNYLQSREFMSLAEWAKNIAR